MKRKKIIYSLSVIVLTGITVFGIFQFIPEKEGSMAMEYEVVYDGVIDHKTLDTFIKVYGEMRGEVVDEDLNPYDLEEVRLLLEDMGYNNTTKLKEVLDNGFEEETYGQVEGILDENLFEQDRSILDSILFQKTE